MQRTSETIDALIAMKKLLEESNVPKEDRWITITKDNPWYPVLNTLIAH